jgi:putative FmdB family regulatory protein
MPTYEFACKKCEHTFDLYLKIDEREQPLSKPCPNCKAKKSVTRNFNNYTQTIGSDATLTPNKATGGRWNELMGRMKKGIAKRYHKNLDVASANTGRHWSG